MLNRETILRKEIVKIGKILYDKNLIVATDGNISARLNKRKILITPSGFCKGRLTANQIVRMGIEDKPIISHSRLLPSLEYQMHIALYAKRPALNAIIHAHPLYATALISADECIKPKALDWLKNLPELHQAVGEISNVAYFPAGSKELAQSVAEKIAYANVVLLANHGIVVGAEDLTQALYRLERVEFGAKLFLLSKLYNKIPG